jgi:hypothetical protein
MRTLLEFITAEYQDTKVGTFPTRITTGGKNVIRALLRSVIDTGSWSNKEKLSIQEIIWRSILYRMAGKNIPLTNNEKRILALHDIHAGKRAFIIGNGPSLNKCDLSYLKNEITFGVNNIMMNYEKMGFHPTYYVVEDILVAEDRARQINQYLGPIIKLFGNYLRYCFTDDPDIVWINVRMNYANYKDFPHFSKNAARELWVGGTVTYLCMQLAYYMGFSELYLVGFDHSYSIPTDAKLHSESTEITSMSDDPNHFSPEYFGKGYRWHDPQVDRMEKAYIHAKQVYESEGRKIFNATIGGQLEVFPRVDYFKLFTEKNLHDNN